jgi:hypothetical protein
MHVRDLILRSATDQSDDSKSRPHTGNAQSHAANFIATASVKSGAPAKPTQHPNQHSPSDPVPDPCHPDPASDPDLEPDSIVRIPSSCRPEGRLLGGGSGARTAGRGPGDRGPDGGKRGRGGRSTIARTDGAASRAGLPSAPGQKSLPRVSSTLALPPAAGRASEADRRAGGQGGRGGRWGLCRMAEHPVPPVDPPTLERLAGLAVVPTDELSVFCAVAASGLSALRAQVGPAAAMWQVPIPGLRDMVLVALVSRADPGELMAALAAARCTCVAGRAEASGDSEGAPVYLERGSAMQADRGALRVRPAHRALRDGQRLVPKRFANQTWPAEVISAATPGGVALEAGGWLRLAPGRSETLGSLQRRLRDWDGLEVQIAALPTRASATLVVTAYGAYDAVALARACAGAYAEARRRGFEALPEASNPGVCVRAADGLVQTRTALLAVGADVVDPGAPWTSSTEGQVSCEIVLSKATRRDIRAHADRRGSEEPVAPDSETQNSAQNSAQDPGLDPALGLASALPNTSQTLTGAPPTAERHEYSRTVADLQHRASGLIAPSFEAAARADPALAAAHEEACARLDEYHGRPTTEGAVQAIATGGSINPTPAGQDSVVTPDSGQNATPAGQDSVVTPDSGQNALVASVPPSQNPMTDLRPESRHPESSSDSPPDSSPDPAPSPPVAVAGGRPQQQQPPPTAAPPTQELSVHTPLTAAPTDASTEDDGITLVREPPNVILAAMAAGRSNVALAASHLRTSTAAHLPSSPGSPWQALAAATGLQFEKVSGKHQQCCLRAAARALRAAGCHGFSYTRRDGATALAEKALTFVGDDGVWQRITEDAVLIDTPATRERLRLSFSDPLSVKGADELTVVAYGLNTPIVIIEGPPHPAPQPAHIAPPAWQWTVNYCGPEPAERVPQPVFLAFTHPTLGLVGHYDCLLAASSPQGPPTAPARPDLAQNPSPHPDSRHPDFSSDFSSDFVPEAGGPHPPSPQPGPQGDFQCDFQCAGCLKWTVDDAAQASEYFSHFPSEEHAHLRTVLHALAGSGTRPARRTTKHTIVRWLAGIIRPSLALQFFQLSSTGEPAKVATLLGKWGDLPGGSTTQEAIWVPHPGGTGDTLTSCRAREATTNNNNGNNSTHDVRSIDKT